MGPSGVLNMPGSILKKRPPDFQYTEGDLLAIARGQLLQEDACAEKARLRKDRFLFIDTDMYVMKIWSEFAYQRCQTWILEQIAVRSYDYYLLCDIDLLWASDPLREYPDPLMRQNLFMHYQDLLLQQNTPFFIVTGQDHTRLLQAVQALENQFSQSGDLSGV